MESLELNRCRIIIYSVVFILLLCFCVRTCYFLIVKKRHSIDSMTNYRWLLFMMILSFIAGFDLLFLSFNDGWWIFTDKTRISRKMDDWGNFASFLTAFFALMSICFAYRALMFQIESAKKSNKDSMKILDLQIKASKRTSFDAAFTQIFAQHHILHAKVVQHAIGRYLRYSGTTPICSSSNTLFSVCKNEYVASRICGIGDFWENFNDDIGNEASIDFKNYFKYIYHEINIVVSQPDEVLNDNAKRNYIQLIQAQMNYDELLCYLINQVEYFNYWRNNRNRNIEIYRRAEEHVRNLHDYGFFRELCKNRSEQHANLVRRIIGTNGNGCINNDFIDESWFPH